MPRPRLPPTPSNSTDIAGKEEFRASDMESVFALPPPALRSIDVTPTTKTKTRTVAGTQPSPPSSPRERRTESAAGRKRTLSGTSRRKMEVPFPAMQSPDTALPPPPSRARKIIQMKPKQTTHSLVEEQPQASSKPNQSQKEPTASSTPTPKRKQAPPSASSAAGRRIARKTAHSIIERRRRSKMNEEFGVLKDMIPACAGVEMHKLAILQAGIEYVRYLEGCVEQLRAQSGDGEHTYPRPHTSRTQDAQDEEDDDDDDNDDDDNDDDEPMEVEKDQRHQKPAYTSTAVMSESDASSPSMSRTQRPLPSFQQSSIIASTTNTSTHTSPDLQPMQSSSVLQTHPTSHSDTQHISQYHSNRSLSPPSASAPTPIQTGVSPAFGAFQLSPDLSRSSVWSSINGHHAHMKASPTILPLPQAAMPMSHAHSQHGTNPTYLGRYSIGAGEGHAEATATAALMMMTKDRRASVTMSRASSGKGMNVRDLLSS